MRFCRGVMQLVVAIIAFPFMLVREGVYIYRRPPGVYRFPSISTIICAFLLCSCVCSYAYVSISTWLIHAQQERDMKRALDRMLNAARSGQEFTEFDRENPGTVEKPGNEAKVTRIYGRPVSYQIVGWLGPLIGPNIQCKVRWHRTTQDTLETLGVYGERPTLRSVEPVAE